MYLNIVQKRSIFITTEEMFIEEQTFYAQQAHREW